MDFAENFHIQHQEASQASYFNQVQTTVFPVVMYTKNYEGGPPVVKPYVFISDFLEHTDAAVSFFQKKLLSEIMRHHPEISKIHYFSYDARRQFKNLKNFRNLCSHKVDFNGIDA